MNEPLTISEAARKLIDDIDRRYDVIFADPGTSSKLEEMAQLAINSVVEPLQKENGELNRDIAALAKRITASDNYQIQAQHQLRLRAELAEARISELESECQNHVEHIGQFKLRAEQAEYSLFDLRNKYGVCVCPDHCTDGACVSCVTNQPNVFEEIESLQACLKSLTWKNTELEQSRDSLRELAQELVNELNERMPRGVTSSVLLKAINLGHIPRNKISGS